MPGKLCKNNPAQRISHKQSASVVAGFYNPAARYYAKFAWSASLMSWEGIDFTAGFDVT